MHRPPAFAAGILHGPDHAETQSPIAWPCISHQTDRQNPGRPSSCWLAPSFLILRTRRHSSGLDHHSHSPALPCCRRLAAANATPGQGSADESGKAMASTVRINRTTGPGQASTSLNHTRCQFFILGCPCTHRSAVDP